MLKKLVSVLLIMVMLFSLAACGGGSSNEFTDDESKEVELTYFYPGGLETANEERINEKLSEYVKDKINAKVKFHRFDWNAYQQKISTMAASGEAFDIVFTTSWCLPYIQNAQKGVFLELDELLKEYGKDILSALDPDFLAASKVDGIQYTIPVKKETAHSVGFLFREDLVNKYGIDVSSIKTLEDVENALKIAKEKDPDLYPLQVGKEGLTALLDFSYVTGSNTTPGALYAENNDNKIFNQYASKEYMELAKTVRRFYENKYIRPDAATSGTGSTDVAFAQVAMLKPGKDKESYDSSRGYSYIQADLTKPMMVTGDATGAMAAISATCKNPVRAMKFLNLLYSDKDLLNLLYYGEEGVDYTLDEEDRVVKKDGMYSASGWMFGNQMIAKLTNLEDPGKWEKIEKFNNEAIVHDSVGFSFDQTNVSTEIATCANVVAEYQAIVGTGVQDPEETIPAFLEKLETAGAQKIIDEAQKQYDEFLKTK